MNIIFVPNTTGKSRRMHVNRWYKMILPLCSLLAVVGGAAYVGFNLGAESAKAPVIAEWQQKLDAQQQLYAVSQKQDEANVTALAQRVGQLSAHMNRIDALGNKLVEMADLDGEEFNFDVAPAIGGPASVLTEDPDKRWPDVVSLIAEYELALDTREQQLRVLDHLILTRNLNSKTSPTGRPVTKGWISSRYGKRTDPFSGKPEMHKGVDFASSLGSDIVAVAAGVVTKAGKRSGYGNMIEIDHGNGHVTRYGHNKENLVKVGDAVKKGQIIGLVGNSGRTTGAHVHFEVLNNGKHVDPMDFISASN